MATATYVHYPVLARMVPLVMTDVAQLYAAFRAQSPAIALVALVPVIRGEEFKAISDC